VGGALEAVGSQAQHFVRVLPGAEYTRGIDLEQTEPVWEYDATARATVAVEDDPERLHLTGLSILLHPQVPVGVGP
jgi:hypothetical protein